MSTEPVTTDTPIRVRPLSITMVGWLGIVCGVIALLQKVSAALSQAGATEPGLSNLNGYVDVLSFGILACCGVSVLKGRAWAPVATVIVLASDLLHSVLLDWTESKHSVPMDGFVFVLVAVTLYLPRNRMFFRARGPASPWYYQGGTAWCYAVITVFLTPLIAWPAAYAHMEPGDVFRPILLTSIPVITYGVANAFGLVVHPRRDVGGIIVVASALSLLFALSLVVRNAGGYGALWNGSIAEPELNLWVVCATTVLGIALGIALMRSSRRGPTPPDGTPVGSPGGIADR